MEELIELVLVLFGLAGLAIPVAALVIAIRARRRAQALERDLDGVRVRLAWLESHVGDIGLANAAAPAPPVARVPAPESSPAPAAAPPSAAPAPTFVPDVPPATPKRAFDWESLIGVRLFAWLGGAALFLGGALFLSYSIQHDLVSPAMRVASGIVFGAAALWFGDRLRAKADFAGQALSGAGVAILYASLFAAASLYHLVGPTPAFVAMALVTLVAGVVAVRRRAFMLAILGLVGGMATPYLLSTGEDRPVALFAYVTLLDVGVLVVAQRRRWPLLGLLGLVGSAVLFAGWSMQFLDSPRAPFALGAAALVAALFAFSRWSPDEAPRGLARLSQVAVCTAVAAPLILALIVGISPSLAIAPAFLAAYLVLLLAGAWVVARRLGVPYILPIAVAAATVTLAARVQPDLFPADGPFTLVLFSGVAAAVVAAWLLRRGSDEARVLRTAAAIALSGSLLTIANAITVEARYESVAALALFAALHVAGLVAIGVLDGEGLYVALGQAIEVGALLLLMHRFQQARLLEFVPVVAIPMVGFWALPLAAPRLRRAPLAWFSSALALVVHFSALYFMAQPTWGPGPLGFIAVCCAALSLVTLRYARATLRDDPAALTRMSALFAGVTLLFLTAAVPILLSDESITVAWALEAASLAWLNRRITHRGLVIAAGGLALAAFARLVVNPALWEYHPRAAVPVLNFYLYAFGVPALAFLAAAQGLGDDAAAARFRLAPGLRIGAAILLFVLLNVEVADAYSTGPTLTFQLTGGGLGQDMTYSLAWGVFALAMLVLGIVRRRTPIRIGALLVLTLTIGKVCLHDLWELGALYRVGSIVGLAVALLAVSFLTQRFVLHTEAR